MNTLIIAIASITLSVSAQFLLKAGMGSLAVKQTLNEPTTWKTLLTVLTNPHIFAGFMLYGIGAIVWLGVLSRWEVSKAYPLVGLGFVLTLLVGLLNGEQITTTRVIGVMLISSGVFLVGRS
jgi:drug/metabolite transporter (DMT)-like permease